MGGRAIPDRIELAGDRHHESSVLPFAFWNQSRTLSIFEGHPVDTANLSRMTNADLNAREILVAFALEWIRKLKAFAKKTVCSPELFRNILNLIGHAIFVDITGRDSAKPLFGIQNSHPAKNEVLWDQGLFLSHRDRAGSKRDNDGDNSDGDCWNGHASKVSFHWGGCFEKELYEDAISLPNNVSGTAE